MSDEELKLCSVPDCHRVAVTRGWCQAHYLRWRRTGKTDDLRRVGEKRNTICEVAGCDRIAITRGLCSTHYGRLKRTGRVDADRRIGARPSPRECSVDKCSAIATERGWCHGHYLRWVRLGELQEERPLSRQVNLNAQSTTAIGRLTFVECVGRTPTARESMAMSRQTSQSVYWSVETRTMGIGEWWCLPSSAISPMGGLTRRNTG